jgi:hypothetical protein
MDHHPGCVDVADLQVRALSEAQPERVNRLQVGLVVGRADRGAESPHFVNGEDIGEFLVSANAEPPQGGPVPGRGVGVEELDPALGDCQ